MGKALGITFGLILIFAGIAFYRTGIYKDVTISSGHQGPFVLVYKLHKGPYHKIIPVIEEVEKHFADLDTPCPLAFGRYLHDPNTVEHDRLESHGGCAFPTMTEALDKLVKESGFTSEVLDKKEYVVATFEGSPSVGPFRVYPKVTQWLEKYGYKHKPPVIEIYQTTGEDAVTTRYLFDYE